MDYSTHLYNSLFLHAFKKSKVSKLLKEASDVVKLFWRASKRALFIGGTELRTEGVILVWEKL
ncbi:hypothetical protein V7149_25815 [Bacillus sp. JJ1503]|uniref:hypothetical protein n=1 Tax=unclassified Bacillus (in: firmicutes) TaxID=185979 RepID=UPI002FFF424D